MQLNNCHMPTFTAQLPTHKYNIKDKLSALPERRRLEIKASIMQSENLSESTYSRYINLRASDKQDIPATVLMRFARELNVQIEDLFN